MKKFIKLLPVLFLVGCSPTATKNYVESNFKDNVLSKVSEDYSYTITKCQEDSKEYDAYIITLYTEKYIVNYYCVVTFDKESGEFVYTYHMADSIDYTYHW